MLISSIVWVSIAARRNKSTGPMTDGQKSLEELRAEIDSLDDAIHDLLMRRVAISGSLAGAKGAAPTLRPAREMEVLRRLAARHRGDMPLAGVVRIWREITAASLALQSDFKVYVLGGDEGRALWDLARFHFGSGTRLEPVSTAGHVVQHVSESQSDIGILPEPRFEDEGPWWPSLLFAGAQGPRIVARLPMLTNAPGYDFPNAFALAKVEQRPTGDDASLIALLADGDLGRAKVASLLEGQGIEARLISVATDDAGRRYMLFETTSFVAEDDSRIGAVQAQSDAILNLKVIGGYARPIACGGEAS